MQSGSHILCKSSTCLRSLFLWPTLYTCTNFFLQVNSSFKNTSFNTGPCLVPSHLFSCHFTFAFFCHRLCMQQIAGSAIYHLCNPIGKMSRTFVMIMIIIRATLHRQLSSSGFQLHFYLHKHGLIIISSSSCSHIVNVLWQITTSTRNINFLYGTFLSVFFGESAQVMSFI